ncbi:hypothetical protein F5Y16DRAFT_384553 [Xylariaceae sp. FL0255]|nr:hypothetical protein F5Y16DRAFT_384553 [Xylariaceae sp. FL0255]
MGGSRAAREFPEAIAERRQRREQARTRGPEDRRCPGSHPQLCSHELRCLREKMVANGWCHHQVQHISKTYDSTTFSYLATLQPSFHRLVSHQGCLHQKKCIAYDTDESTYHIRHTADGCSCEMISTPYKKLVDVIKSGKIPLVSIENHLGSQPKLQIHSRSPGSQYNAISHVWADGLGNFQANAIPTCRLLQINHSLRKLQFIDPNSKNSFLFWMDTLCIPTGHQHKSLRMAQIDSMASIYIGAAAVLVLDAELMSTASQYDPAAGVLCLETRARIALSAWMSRSWTFQEGRLPKKIALQFQDDIIMFGRASETNGKFVETSIKNELERLKYPRQAPTTAQEHQSRPLDGTSTVRYQLEPNVERSLSRCVCAENTLELAFFEVFFQETHDLISVWNVLSSRTTSKPEDIHFILTNILSLNNQPLFQHDESHERFQLILLSLQQLPISIFFNTGKRHDPEGNHNNRWIPREIGSDTLLSSGSVSVCPTHLSCLSDEDESSPPTRPYGFFTVDEIIPFQATTHLFCGGATFETGPARSTSDRLNMENFTTTYVLMDLGPPLPYDERERRAACFYASLFGNLTFVCPLRLRKLPSHEPKLYESYSLRLVRRPDRLRITYDPLASFQPLKGKDGEWRVDRFLLLRSIVVIVGLLSWLGIGVVAIKVIQPLGGSMLPNYLIAFIGGLLTFLSVVFLFEDQFVPYVRRRLAWGYIRSFQAVVNIR